MIKLLLPSKANKLDAIDYIKEFHIYNSSINGTGGLDINHYENWLEQSNLSHSGITIREDRVPASTYFAYNEENKLVGMCNIRHHLSDYLIKSGSGHIGYSVRPIERQKGYATEILKNALRILHHEHQVNTALIGCYKENIASKKAIIKNGGVLHQEIIENDEVVTLAYHIHLV